MRIVWVLVCSALAAAIGAADAPAKIYAQELIDRAAAKNPDVLVLAMHVKAPHAADNVIVASNIGRIGKKADADDLRVIATGKPNLAVNARGDRFEAEVALEDANGRTIGALGVVFRYQAGDDQATLERRATAIRDRLARRISHVANLMEPAQFDTSFPTANYGQELVDRALERHPKVVILALHAKPSPSKDNEIVASNIGRIGKKADEDDLHVIESGEAKLEFNETKDRYEVEQTLLDVSGTVIGAVGVVFPYRKGDDTKPLQAEAAVVRGELSRRISNADNLVQPYPFDAGYSSSTVAQTLLDASLASNDDVLIMALHAAAPGGSDYVIAASNIGRIGKKADQDDLSVIKSGKPLLEVNAAGNRFEVELPLNDASQRRLGALSAVFAYQPGSTDKQALQRRAEAIRDALARRIPSAAALFEPGTP